MRECVECRRLDAVASHALSTGDKSALSDVKVLRERHAPKCEVPRGGGEV